MKVRAMLETNCPAVARIYAFSFFRQSASRRPGKSRYCPVNPKLSVYKYSTRAGNSAAEVFMIKKHIKNRYPMSS